MVAAIHHVERVAGRGQGFRYPLGEVGMVFHEEAGAWCWWVESLVADYPARKESCAQKLCAPPGGASVSDCRACRLRTDRPGAGDVRRCAAAWAQSSADLRVAAAREGVVVIYAATDERAWHAVAARFTRLYPGVRVEYHDMNSVELYRRFLAEQKEGSRADVLWSSAMDLQVKLVNDGHAQPHRSAETAALPSWAVEERSLRHHLRAGGDGPAKPRGAGRCAGARQPCRNSAPAGGGPRMNTAGD